MIKIIDKFKPETTKKSIDLCHFVEDRYFYTCAKKLNILSRIKYQSDIIIFDNVPYNLLKLIKQK